MTASPVISSERARVLSKIGSAHWLPSWTTSRAAFGIRRKRGRSDQALGRWRGGWTTKIHAFIDVVGRPLALMLTSDNVSDVAAAPTLLERAAGCDICSGTRATMRTGCGVRYAKQEPLRSSRVGETETHNPL